MIKIVISPKLSLGHTLAWLFTLLFSVSALAGPPKPQIPMHNFEWQGSFIGNAEKLSDPQVEYKLTVRGKWQNGYFNLYMEQGTKDDDTWVENLIYEDKLYTITHKWHTEFDLKGICFQNMVYNTEDPWKPLPITVAGFNRGLQHSRLVGLEKIGGKPMNHFRHTCLSLASPQFGPLDPDDPENEDAIPFKVFSDIYVPAGRSYPWIKWLQSGDGVGPDPQQDEWFIANKSKRNPDNIVLPWQCILPIYVQQTTCTNPRRNRSNYLDFKIKI